jgi:hypothetical protein
MGPRSEDILSMAARHVREGGARVARQRQLVVELLCHGYDARMAQNVLATLETSLRQYQEHLAALLTATRRPRFVYARAERSTLPRHRAARTWSSCHAPGLGEALRQIEAELLTETVPEKLLRALGKERDAAGQQLLTPGLPV